MLSVSSFTAQQFSVKDTIFGGRRDEYLLENIISSHLHMGKRIMKSGNDDIGLSL